MTFFHSNEKIKRREKNGAIVYIQCTNVPSKVAVMKYSYCYVAAPNCFVIIIAKYEEGGRRPTTIFFSRKNLLRNRRSRVSTNSCDPTACEITLCEINKGMIIDCCSFSCFLRYHMVKVLAAFFLR